MFGAGFAFVVGVGPLAALARPLELELAAQPTWASDLNSARSQP